MQGQWVGPNILQTSGAIYAGYATRGGQFGVARTASIPTVTQVNLATREADDHNVPALIQTLTGKILAVYSRHAQVTTVYNKVSASNDAIDFGSERTFTASDVATYMHLFRLAGAARIWAMYRVGSSSGGTWGIRYTDDEGATWTAERTLCPNTYVTAVMDPDGVHVRCFAYDHPTLDTDHDIYYFRVNLATGDVIDSSGVSLGNADTGAGLPVTKSEEHKALDVSGSVLTRLYEAGRVSGAAFLASEFTDENSGTYYRYTYASAGAAFTRQAIATSGPAFFAGGSDYFGGAAFDESSLDTVYVARNLGGSVGRGSWELVRMKTTDGGANWTRDAVITTSGNILARPQVRAGRIWWLEISRYVDFNDFSGGLCSVALS